MGVEAVEDVDDRHVGVDAGFRAGGDADLGAGPEVDSAAVAIVGVGAGASVASVDSTVGVWPGASGGRDRLLPCPAAVESSDCPSPGLDLSAVSATASAAVDAGGALG